MAEYSNAIRRKVTGYAAGIAAGVSYGLNPLFAKPLMEGGMPVTVMLMFRYLISVALVGLMMVATRESFRITRREIPQLVLLGVFFACSSIFLFASYEYIPSGLATTLVYLYPVFVALIMVFLKFYPSWQTWLSIIATFGGILLLSSPSAGEQIRPLGIALAVISALSYSGYLVIVNRSKTLRSIPENKLTFYVLVSGTILFALLRLFEYLPAHPEEVTALQPHFIEGLHSLSDAANLLGLAIFPTIISLLTLAVSSRNIGPTRTSVLGVFEPITAILVGTLVFTEPFTLRMALGIAICVSSVIFMILKPGK
ncbi:MAG: DMT family transporter [Candidatus Cryptobacteroides sp.]